MSTELHNQAVDLLQQLVAIDSVNPGLVPDAAGESAIVEFLKTRLESTGFTTHVVPALGSSNRPSLIAIGPSSPDLPVVVLNGHLDTVGVKGMDNPFTARIEGDRLYGRGAADMKGGVSAMVVVAEALARTPGQYRPVLALVADEEDASSGSEAVIAALPSLGITPELCVIAEPTDVALAHSLRGFAVVEVSFTGRASHSSQPEFGVNAVTQLGKLLAAVENRAQVIRESGGDLMVTVVRGGDSPFVIPDAASCVIEYRTIPGQRAGEAADLVRQLCDPTWDVSVNLLAHREAWELDATGPARECALSLSSVLGTAINFEAPYWMEATLWQEACPTVICGPSGGGLHAIDEWVDLNQVRNFTTALLAVLSS